MHWLSKTRINDASMFDASTMHQNESKLIDSESWCIKMNRFGIMMHQNESIIITLVRVYRNPWAVSQICIKKRGRLTGDWIMPPFSPWAPSLGFLRKIIHKTQGYFYVFSQNAILWNIVYMVYMKQSNDDQGGQP